MTARRKNPRKGKVPPQLKRFLFKKGHRAVKRKRALAAIANIRSARIALNRKIGRRSTRRRRKNPPTAYAARPRRYRKSLAQRAYYIITADRAGKRLKYDGAHFSNKHAARKFITIELAAAKARQLLKSFPVLRGYAVYVRKSH